MSLLTKEELAQLSAAADAYTQMPEVAGIIEAFGSIMQGRQGLVRMALQQAYRQGYLDGILPSIPVDDISALDTKPFHCRACGRDLEAEETFDDDDRVIEPYAPHEVPRCCVYCGSSEVENNG